MKRKVPVPMERYRHFKGQSYQILNIAQKEDTGETLVIYQALYGEFKVYARELGNFLSEVDHAKYPAATQQYRFERISGWPEGAEGSLEGEDPLKSAEADESANVPSGAKVLSNAEEERTAPEEKPADAENERKAPKEKPADAKAERKAPKEKPADAKKEGKALEEHTEPAEQNFRGAEPESELQTEETLQLDPMLERFLDARTTTQRLDILERMRSYVTNEMIDTMAVVVGVEVAENEDVRIRYDDLHDCLLTKRKYEILV